MMTEEEFIRATDELMFQKRLSLEEVELVKMRFGVGYPTPYRVEEISKIYNKPAILIKIRLRYIEKKIIMYLNS